IPDNDNARWSVTASCAPAHLLSFSARSSPYIYLSLTRFKLAVVPLSTLLAYSTLGVLLHNCCWLLLNQLRIGDCYCCCNFLAANR
ncbi:unnamed protein product, partial [Hymenolepis diminuta]